MRLQIHDREEYDVLDDAIGHLIDHLWDSICDPETDPNVLAYHATRLTYVSMLKERLSQLGENQC